MFALESAESGFGNCFRLGGLALLMYISHGEKQAMLEWGFEADSLLRE